MRKGTFEAPRRASASHLIHLIGIDQFSQELEKQQKAKAAGILEVITATSIRRDAPASKREQEMMNVAHKMHIDGEINDLIWSQIRAIFVYLGAAKDRNGHLEVNTINFPEDWEPAQDLAFAKRLLPKFLHYQLQEFKELGQSIDSILEKAGALKGTSQPEKPMTSEQLRRAEELANWQLIKDSKDKKDFQNFLKYFKGGAYERLAYIKLEEIAWKELGPEPDYKEIYYFLQSFPYGRHADEAKARIQKLAQEAQRKSYEDYQKRKSAVDKSRNTLNYLRRLGETILYKTRTLLRIPSKSNSRAVANTVQNQDMNYRVLAKSFLAGIMFSVLCVAVLLVPALTPWAGEKAVRTFSGHTKSIKAVAFLPDSRFALSASADQTLKLWNMETGKEVRTFIGHTGIVSSLAISPDGQTALSGSHDKTMKLWNLRTGKIIQSFEGHYNWVVSVAFSEDGHLALSGSHDKTIKLWHVASGKLLRTFTGHKDWVIAVSFVADTNAILSGSHDKTLKLWDMGTGQNVRTFFGHEDWVTSLTTSRYNLTALSGSYDKTLRLWNMKTGETMKLFDQLDTSGINSVTFTPDEKMALASSLNKRIVLWNILTGKKIRTFRGHESSATNNIAVSPDGKFALSGGEDHTIKLWNLFNR